ncbi:MAG: DUF5915 domain-containing protein, partial [Clostridia bacterium]|nr:DUF5915 domain-containing protein [Clostridia bacterium]
LNVKEIEFIDDASKFVKYLIKPQLKTLGPKYGAKLGKIRAFFADCNTAEIVSTVKKGETYKTNIDGDEFEFTLDDLLISSESMEGFVASSDNGLTVVMDTHITPELKAEGIEREIISKIQSMRKDAGFEVVNRINVGYETADDEIKHAFTQGKDLKSVILADEIKEGLIEGAYSKEIDVNGAKCVVSVEISK